MAAQRTSVHWEPTGKVVYYDKVAKPNNGGYILKVYDSETDGRFLGNYKSEDEIKNDLKDDSIFEKAEFMESFILDPLLYAETFDPATFFKEDYISEATAIYEDATAPTQKKNVGKKILDFIKKIGELIIRALRAIGTFIKNLFKRKAKSVDQVLDKLGVPAKNVSPDQGSEVEIPSAEDSEYEIERKCYMAVKPMQIKLEENGSMVITTKDVVASAWLKHKQGTIKANNGSFFQVYLAHAHNTAFKAMLDKDVQDTIREVADLISTKSDDLRWSNLSDIETKLQSVFSDPHKEYRVTLKQINELNDTLVYAMDKMSKVADSTGNDQWASQRSSILNEFSTIMAVLQFGTNTITGCLKDIYIIDAEYAESISNTDILSKFVGQMISASIPTKYVAMNTWLVSTKDIKGEADAFKPVWGQSRVVFFPPEKSIVHKVAINPYGIRSNFAENSVYGTMQRNNAAELLAKTEKISSNGVILDMERISGSRPTQAELLTFTTKLQKAAGGSNIAINDLHLDNVKKTKDGMKAFDYGMFVRL